MLLFPSLDDIILADSEIPEDHLNIKIVQLCLFIKPTGYFIELEIWDMKTNTLKIHPRGMARFKKTCKTIRHSYRQKRALETEGPGLGRYAEFQDQS